MQLSGVSTEVMHLKMVRGFPLEFVFFKFPEEPSEKTVWCNKIKRQDGKDGFRVNESTRVCEKHFESFKIYRPPGGTRWRLIDGTRPL